MLIQRQTVGFLVKCWFKVNNLTCIVDEDVQSGFGFQEVFSKTANRLETSKIQLHEHHLVTVTLLWDILKISTYE